MVSYGQRHTIGLIYSDPGPLLHHMAAVADRRPEARGLSSRYIVMGVTPRQNGILSHESLRGEEGADDCSSYQHYRADSSQVQRKIFGSFADHISLLIDAQEGGTSRTESRSRPAAWQVVEKPCAGDHAGRDVDRAVNRAEPAG